MCGIAGAIWNSQGQPLAADVLQRMTDVLRHRGPDDEGFYRSNIHLTAQNKEIPGVALGHRRLSIIDLASGHQPLTNEDKSVWVIFNGEIYNFRELRHRLEGSGHRFRTDSDTETIVHLYEDEGTDCFAHLNGMFAIALWDANRRQLILARDRLGQKPLVYRLENGRLLFASQLKSLLEVPGVSRDIDAAALDAYLTYQYVPHPRTIFKGIAKLPPGHMATYRDGRLSIKPYWRPDFNRETNLSATEASEQLETLLESSVRLRMQSDVPLGAFLSGGVDSSIIVSQMQRLSDRPVQTFSIGFPVPEYDETRYAREVSEHLGTDHHELRVEPSALDVLPKLVWHYDEPFADSSAIPTYIVSQLAREHVTVALSGDGGDELFAGYDRYRAVRLGAWFDRLPQAMRGAVTANLWQRLPSSSRQKSISRRAKRLLQGLAFSPGRRYLEWIAIFNESRRAELYSEEFLTQLPEDDPYDFLDKAFSRAQHRDRVTATSLADLMTYLPCDLMTKVDVASMAHGLECRQPLLDYRLVEFAASLPLHLKLGARRSKRILIDTFGHRLPRSVRHRRKMGFGVPLDRWFREDLGAYTREVLLDRRATERGYFQPTTVRRLIDEHQQGTFDHSYRLWSLLFLELWMRQWID